MQTMYKRSSSPFSSPTSISYQMDPVYSSAPTIKKNFISELYYNPRLEGKIASIEAHSLVDFSYWNLIDQDISIITKKLLADKQCIELCLCGNKITPQGASTIASKLPSNSFLKTLDLSYNSISNEGVRSISQNLSSKHQSALKTLSLNKNGISNDGAGYLAKMLQSNQTLVKLFLSDNEIGDQGVKQLANVLRTHNRTLKYLGLSFNVFITDACVEHLVRMLESNHTLKELSINDCNLSEAGKLKLRETVRRKTNFEIVM